MTPTATARAVRPWLAPVLLVVMAGTAGGNAGDRPAMGLALALAGLASLTVLVPLRRPGPLLGVNGVAVGTYLALGLAPGPIFLTVALSTLVVALAAPPRAWVAWSVVGLLLVAAGSATGWLRGLAGGAETVWPWWAMAALAAAAGALATVVRVRAEARGDRAERAAAEERLRMAQDLHDGVGHGLAVVAMQAGVALHVLDRDPIAARASLEAIRAASRESLDLLREELSRLADPQDRAARARAPVAGPADLVATLDRVRSGGVRTDLVVEADGVRLDGPEDLGLGVEVVALAHRVVQESLTNALRHAGARSVRVTLRVSDGVLDVEVIDDGAGPAAGATPGLGLRGMRSRVEAAGGVLATGAAPAGGFEVVARLPLGSGVGDTLTWSVDEAAP